MEATRWHQSSSYVEANFQQRNEWDLPFFTYPDSLNHSGDRCAADLESMLMISALPDRRAFTVVVDPQISLRDLHLPPHAEWKDARFVASLLKSLDHGRGNRPALEVTLKYLRATSDYIAENRDPRYRLGWFNSAANWLQTEVVRHGNIPTGKVVQELVSSTSTLLSLECSSCTFYLNAPVLGCEEPSITAAVASLFPENTVDVVAISGDLHSFIMRGFNHIEPGKNQLESFVKTLGNIQLQSLKRLDTLKAAGCEDRGPNLIAEKLCQWTKDEEERRTFGLHFETWDKLLPILVDMCSRVAAYNIPMTLVHGDFDRRNATVVGARVGCEGPEFREESDKVTTMIRIEVA